MAGPSDGAKGFSFFIVNMELTEEGEGMYGGGHLEIKLLLSVFL